MPFSPFTREWFTLQTRDAEGTVRTTRTRLYDPEASRRRDMGLLAAGAAQIGRVASGKVGRLRVGLVRAADVLRACEEMAGQGRFVTAPADEKNAGSRFDRRATIS